MEDDLESMYQEAETSLPQITEIAKISPRRDSPCVKYPRKPSHPSHPRQSQQSQQPSKTCPHTHIFMDESISAEICSDCGEVIETIISSEPEWRKFEDDTGERDDPSRCTTYSSDDKGISKELERLELPEEVIKIADEYYSKISEGKTHRSTTRTGLIFACVYNAYQDLSVENPDAYNTVISKNLQKKFCLQKKHISRGLKTFDMKMKEKKIKRSKRYVKPENYICDILKNFKLRVEFIKRAIKKYFNLSTKSPEFKKSYPVSVAAGFVFFYLRNLGSSITSIMYSKKVGLSEITILKIAKEFEKVNSESGGFIARSRSSGASGKSPRKKLEATGESTEESEETPEVSGGSG